MLSIIVAASENNVIGKQNRLIWHLPEDIRFFKNTTWGMPIIMGRKSFEALGNKPLPGRFNIVVSRQQDFKPGNASVQMAPSLEAAISLAKDTDCREIFIGGGGEIYREAIGHCNRIYLTRVHATLEGDAFFPGIDPSKWSLVSDRKIHPDEKHGYGMSFQLWEANPF
jgi:dihydrofolate reductase